MPPARWRLECPLCCGERRSQDKRRGRSSGRNGGLLATLGAAELNDARCALVRRQMLSVHVFEQRFFFRRQVKTFACERGPHAGAAATDFRKFGLGEAACLGHLLSFSDWSVYHGRTRAT